MKLNKDKLINLLSKFQRYKLHSRELMLDISAVYIAGEIIDNIEDIVEDENK